MFSDYCLRNIFACLFLSIVFDLANSHTSNHHHHHHHHQNHHHILHDGQLQKNLDDSISYTDYLITIYSSSTAKPCLYFFYLLMLFEAEGRFSQPDSSLINCTWYKANSCCKRTEVASVFVSMFTLYRASKHCMDLMNYMMCYFCSPDQYIWYRSSRALVCSSFCADIYEHCKEAEYAGRKLGDMFQSGRQFCESQDFTVSEANNKCFGFDPTPFSRASRLFRSHLKLSLLLASLVFFLL